MQESKIAMPKIKSTITIVAEYDINLDHYGVDNIEDAIDIDIKNFNEDPYSFMDAILGLDHGMSVKLEASK